MRNKWSGTRIVNVHPLEIEILIASCCNREEIERGIQPLLQKMKSETPDLRWTFRNVDEEPEIMIKHAVPSTPAILMNGKLEFIGMPRHDALESKIRQYATR